MSIDYTDKNFINEEPVKPSEPEYEAIEADAKAKMTVNYDIKMDANPAYQAIN